MKRSAGVLFTIFGKGVMEGKEKIVNGLSDQSFAARESSFFRAFQPHHTFEAMQASRRKEET